MVEGARQGTVGMVNVGGATRGVSFRGTLGKHIPTCVSGHRPVFSFTSLDVARGTCQSSTHPAALVLTLLYGQV